MDFSLPNNDLVLPVSLRAQLKEPWGELIRPGDDSYTAFLQYVFPQGTRLITIGDFCTKVMMTQAQTKPFLLVTDGQTKRQKLQQWEHYPEYVETEIHNPPGTISAESFQVIKNILHGSQKTHLLVKGEEDLLVLPALVLGKENDVIIYGQPNEGMVIVQITLSKQLKAKKIIAQMEIDKHGN